MGSHYVLAETELHGSYLFQYSSQVFEIFTVSFLHDVRIDGHRVPLALLKTVIMQYVFKSSILTFTYSSVNIP